jgi:hypothetical protein
VVVVVEEEEEEEEEEAMGRLQVRSQSSGGQQPKHFWVAMFQFSLPNSFRWDGP